MPRRPDIFTEQALKETMLVDLDLITWEDAKRTGSATRMGAARTAVKVKGSRFSKRTQDALEAADHFLNLLSENHTCMMNLVQANPHDLRAEQLNEKAHKQAICSEIRMRMSIGWFGWLILRVVITQVVAYLYERLVKPQPVPTGNPVVTAFKGTL